MDTEVPKKLRGEKLRAHFVDDDETTNEKRHILRTEEKEEKTLQCGFLSYPCTGYICGISSAIMFTTHALLFKLNEDVLHFSNALFSRMIIGVVTMATFIVCGRDSFLSEWNDFKWILLSSMLFLGSNVFFYVASSMMPFADAIAIFFTQCGPTVIFAWLFLDEPFGLYEVGILISASIGVILVAHPPDLFLDRASNPGLKFTFNSTNVDNFWELFYIKALDQTLASLIAFCATLCASLNLVVLRGVTHVSAFTINFYVSLIGASFAAVLISLLSSWRVRIDELDEALLIAAQSFSGFLAGLLLIVATRSLEAGIVSVLVTLEIVFAYIVQLVVLNETPSVSAAIGALLISVVCVMFGLKGWCEKRQDDGIANSRQDDTGRTSHW